MSAGQADRVAELTDLNKNRYIENGNLFREKLKVISFSSGKGGTGKTFLSLNIAHALSDRNKNVLFIDLDINLSNAHLLLNVVASKTVYDFFENKCPLSEVIIKPKGNLHFIFGESGRLNYAKPSAGAIDEFFNELHTIEKEYDVVILDIGSGTGNEVINFLFKSDINVVVTTPEPTSVMDAYVVLKLLKASRFNGYKTIVVNRSSSLSEGKTTFINLNSASANFLKEKVNLLGIIEYNRTVSETIINQTLFLKQYPNSKTAIQIYKLASRLEEIQQMANIHQP